MFLFHIHSFFSYTPHRNNMFSMILNRNDGSSSRKITIHAFSLSREHCLKTQHWQSIFLQHKLDVFVFLKKRYVNVVGFDKSWSESIGASHLIQWPWLKQNVDCFIHENGPQKIFPLNHKCTCKKTWNSSCRVSVGLEGSQALFGVNQVHTDARHTPTQKTNTRGMHD